MSKAFDTVLRDKLLSNLEKILNADKLHLLSILTNRPTLRVRVDQTEGDIFETYLGIMQGDCLSAVLFIFYLAEGLDENNELTEKILFSMTVFFSSFYNYLVKKQEMEVLKGKEKYLQ